MSTNALLPVQPRNEALYNLARRRVNFQRRALTQLVILLFLTAVWYLTAAPGVPFWPAYAAIGFGVGLAIRYTKYYLLPGTGSVESEYQKLTSR